MSASSRRWERARAHTRACILEAAAQAFEESGYADTCMHRIAEIAGFTKATVYAHYRDKARLFAAVMEMHASNFPIPVLPTSPLQNLKDELAYVAREIQRLADVRACRSFCTTLQRSGSGAEFYIELWNAYFAPHRQYVVAALTRESVELAEHHADLYLQLMMQANSLHAARAPEPNKEATLMLFHQAFSRTTRSAANRSLLDTGSRYGPGSPTKQ
ncbi:helix-turn-helix domain-containing protein [Pseudoxanthomonas sacheonensis]|uniref:AcrR family transcriptional regulator n=1 Tax=Pseudoxanthomonas sacheonensis TaxID=443615 RepID=A0ABU1RP46_9GAMM|nr:helix-turn-helix domain-containing protein [Pseudoxanthomonas sacheonensis]MDR6840105.1 AcrR family transcriptional regulator [Pseudoxanthomonas sacheonensis]